MSVSNNYRAMASPKVITLVGSWGGPRKRGPSRPAEEMYNSELFRSIVTWINHKSETNPQWWILDAAHHILHPKTVIEGHSVSFTEMCILRQRQWKKEVTDKLARIVRANHYLFPGRELLFEVHASRKYVELLPLMPGELLHTCYAQVHEELDWREQAQWYKETASQAGMSEHRV